MRGVVLHGVEEIDPPANCALQQQRPRSASWTPLQWGLATTKLLAPGDALVTVPKQALICADQAEEVTLQLALAALPYIPSLLNINAATADMQDIASVSGTAVQLPTHSAFLADSHTARNSCSTDTPTHNASASTADAEQHRAASPHPSGQHIQLNQEDVGQMTGTDPSPSGQNAAVLSDLVSLWLPTGRVRMTWPAELALALLCPDCPSTAAAGDELGAMQGETPALLPDIRARALHFVLLLHQAEATLQLCSPVQAQQPSSQH